MPAVLYVTVGFWSVEVEGVPPSKVHDQVAASPDKSVKFTELPVQM